MADAATAAVRRAVLTRARIRATSRSCQHHFRIPGPDCGSTSASDSILDSDTTGTVGHTSHEGHQFEEEPMETGQSARAGPAASMPTEAPAAAGGRVETSNWSFYGRGDSTRPTPFLVGPIVGAVTDTTARILIEVNTAMLVTMDGFMDGVNVCSVSQNVRGKTPTAFKLKGFSPGRRVRVVVRLATEFRQDREARFTTVSDKMQWKIAVVSCNCHTHIETLKLWERLGRVVEDVDCVLHLGDQVYADEDFGAKESGLRFDSAWESSLKILEGVAKGDWNSRRAQILEYYRETYRRTWNIPAVATVLASAANYMICDDHEFVDNLGDDPKHCDPSSVEFYVARVGYQVFCEYQKQLFEDVNVGDHTVRPYYSFHLSPKVGLFMTDNRVERSLHRADRPEADWKDRGFMGPTQWDRLTEAFSTDFAECETVLLITPTPLILVSPGATDLMARILDDALGTWGHKNFMTEQKALTSLISDWQTARPNRAVVTLGGDVHIGGFTDSWHNGSSVQLHQMTSSAIGNTPERDIDSIKEMLMRGVMHADEKFFSFKVKHYGWIFGPNYGMVDIHLNKSERPDISRMPKIRNLQLGNSKIGVKNADQSPASQSAYATAKVMEPPPEGFPGPPPNEGGCTCCTCSII